MNFLHNHYIIYKRFFQAKEKHSKISLKVPSKLFSIVAVLVTLLRQICRRFFAHSDGYHRIPVNKVY